MNSITRENVCPLTIQIVEYVESSLYRNTEEDLAHIIQLIGNSLPGNVLEIGVGIGVASMALLPAAAKYGKGLVAIDPFSLSWEDMPHSYGVGGGYIKEKFLANMAPLISEEARFSLVEKSSQDIKQLSGTYCFAFVDGLQYEDAVLHDLNLVKDVPIVCVDDFKRLTDISQVPLAVNEFLKSNFNTYDLIVDHAEIRSKAFLIRKDICPV